MEQAYQSHFREFQHPEPSEGLVFSPEWLVTNGLGGYSSGTVAGMVTRHYHGLLVAALPAPYGRTVVLTALNEEVLINKDSLMKLSHATQSQETVMGRQAYSQLRHFSLELGTPLWRYDLRGALIEKRIIMPHHQNTVLVEYRLIDGPDEVDLLLTPLLALRDATSCTVTTAGDRYEVDSTENYFGLRFKLYAPEASFVQESQSKEVFYSMEHALGYSATGMLFGPGCFMLKLGKKKSVSVLASTESWDVMLALTPDEMMAANSERKRRLIARATRTGRLEGAEALVQAADQFIVVPRTRTADAVRLRAAGHDLCSVIAGYHWFTDWGRDTMISLEGLTLCTGRNDEAASILRTFSYYVKDGLIPNMFPEGMNEARYNTADAAFWFFHAIDRYLAIRYDYELLQQLLPKLEDMIEYHIRGTSFGIGMDPADYLMRQGSEGLQLTWMDAKVGDWVVTPRRGKAVEINALWYNALRLMAKWARDGKSGHDANKYSELADKVQESFNRRFWYEEGGYLYDVIDSSEGGHDASLRPNQIFSISLPNAVLCKERWEPVMYMVEEHLLTPVGLRSLAPQHKDYKPRYEGDLESRDASYHQGTVWAWLIGPYIDAWIRLHPEKRSEARKFLLPLLGHLNDACIGSLSEIFEAEAPHNPRGCVAQAWSVAEVIRCWQKTAP